MLTRGQILEAFAALNERMKTRDTQGELALLGGAVMLLAFRARLSTKDVDAIFSPTGEIRAAAAEVAQELGLEPDWLNDGAKGFVSPQAQFVESDLPRFSHLRITYPTPEYLAGDENPRLARGERLRARRPRRHRDALPPARAD